jgi:hypothetical protein
MESKEIDKRLDAGDLPSACSSQAIELGSSESDVDSNEYWDTTISKPEEAN